MSIEIGLREVYDKLCALEDKWDDRWQSTAIELARMELRLAALEQKPAKSQPWIATAIAAIAVVVAVVSMFVK